MFEYIDGKVKLNGKTLGLIKETKDGFQYWPQGRKKYAGPFYETLTGLKSDIEGDD